jgi:FHS family Na+ dependent glucose MFS transporter 1
MPAERTDHWPATAGYFGSFVVVGLVTAVLGPTLPSLAAQTGTQLGAISFLFTGHALGYMLGSFFGGRLYDRMPGHPVMVSMLLLMAAMLALIPLVPVLWLLTAAWLVLGVAGGALDVGGNTLMVWLHGREVGPFMNALHFFFGVGSFVTPIVVALALTLSGGVRPAYWVLALLVVPAALWLVRLPSPSSPVATPRREKTPAAAPSWEPGLAPLGSPALADSNRVYARQPTKHEESPRRTVILIALLLGLYVAAEAAFGGWIYTYAVALDLSDATMAAYLTSAFWGALTVGRLFSIPLAARFSPGAILTTDLVGCVASVGILLLWPDSRAVIWAGTLGLGLFMASVFPTAMTLAGHRLSLTGEVTGWFLVAASLGAMSMPWLIGQLFEPVGPRSAMALLFLDLVLACTVLIPLLREGRPSSLSAAPGSGDTGSPHQHL